jgi:hypothetical protein
MFGKMFNVRNSHQCCAPSRLPFSGEIPAGAPDEIERTYSVHIRRIEKILSVFENAHHNIWEMERVNELSIPSDCANQAAIGYFGGDRDEVEARER